MNNILRDVLEICVLTSLAVLLFFPIKDTVVLCKDDVVSIRPFAGRVNDMMVGTDVTCAYWLHKEQQPDVAMYVVWSTPITYMFGTPLSVELQ